MDRPGRLAQAVDALRARQSLQNAVKGHAGAENDYHDRRGTDPAGRAQESQAGSEIGRVNDELDDEKARCVRID